MYAQVCTRPDIVFVVSVLDKYQYNLGKVMRYLNGTRNQMLVYRRVDNLEVVGHTDSNFGTCSDDRKSSIGIIFMMA